MLDLNVILTSGELQTRKRWLLFFLIVSGFSFLISFLMFWILPQYKLRSADFVFAIASSLIMPCLWYYFCYKKHTTFLLTLNLISSFLGLFGFFVSFLLILFTAPQIIGPVLTATLLLVSGLFISMALYLLLLTWRFRKVNKLIQCYKRHPFELCEAACTYMREAHSLEHLESLHNEGIKKWPSLRHLLERERRLLRKLLKNG